jgi:hypothetical protein
MFIALCGLVSRRFRRSATRRSAAWFGLLTLALPGLMPARAYFSLAKYDVPGSHSDADLTSIDAAAGGGFRVQQDETGGTLCLRCPMWSVTS